MRQVPSWFGPLLAVALIILCWLVAALMGA